MPHGIPNPALYKPAEGREGVKKYKLAASISPWAVFPALLLLVYLFIFKAGCPGDQCLVDFMEWAEEMG